MPTTRSSPSSRSALAFTAEPGSMLDFGHRQIERAANHLDLDPATVARLREADRLVEVTVPDPRADGGIIRAFRSQHSSALGPSKGGVRMAASVTRAEVEAPSLFMSLKTATADLPLGGGKGGIAVDAAELSEGQRIGLMTELASVWAEVIGPDVDVLGPDVGTGEVEMDAVHRAW